ncbi:MAG: hypothetical protein LBQ15_05830, partial [Clostridium sp.]|nr:hypothetical protein [Clostridium sp.]
TYQEYDADGAYAFFFGDYGEGDVQARQWDMVDREGRQAPGVYYWRMPEDDSLSLYPTAATYTKQADFGYYALIFTNERASSSAYNADRYSRSAPLAFASREECAARILEALDALGYVPGATVQTAYALDAPALRREEEAFIESFGTEDVESQLKADWDTQDEAYVFYLWQECQGLPVWTAPLEPYSGLMEESEAPMQAILRRDGFVYFRVTDVLDLRIAEEYSALLPLGDIIQGVIRKYSNLISEQRIVVTDMRLCALTSKDGLGGCSLIPVWICTYEVEDDYAVGQMVFDAVTGYEIYAN